MAITESLVRSAVQHLRAGQRGEAAKLCRDILRVEPAHARAHCMLALIASEEGDRKTALALLERAAQLNDRLPDVPRAQAEVYMAMGDVESALAAQRRATGMNPREPVGHLQESILLQRMERHDEAEKAARRALLLRPGHVGALQMLGGLLYRRGALAEATTCLLEARRSTTTGGDPNHELALALLAQGRAVELADLPPATLVNQQFGEFLVRAIDAWTAGDVAACRTLMDEARPYAGNAVLEAPHRAVFRTYGGIIEGLLAWRAAEPGHYPDAAAATVHAIGDSHVLAAAGLGLDLDGTPARIRAHLVFGCKAWHLVREEPSPWRAFYEATADRLPRGATVMALFGELDCRYKEGIMRALRRDASADWQAMTDELAGRYVGFLADEADRRGWTLWLVTPPMSNVNTSMMAAAERAVFLGIIERFSARLREAAAARGLRLVDLHARTRDPDGAPRHEIYIDSNHVRPTPLLEALSVA